MNMLNKRELLKTQFCEFKDLQIPKTIEFDQNEEEFEQKQFKSLDDCEFEDNNTLKSSISTRSKSKLSMDISCKCEFTPQSSKSMTFAKTKSDFLRTRNLTLDFGLDDKRNKLEKLFKTNNLSIEELKLPASQQNLENKDSNEESDDDIANEYQKQESDYEKQYIELEEIGKGCQAVVKKVEEIATQKIYAAKIFFHMNEDEMRSIIKNEYETLLNIDHPNIIKVKELIEQENESIIIMEYVNGENLEYLKYQNLPLQQILKIISDLVQITEYIHGKNIIHRDIQNKNVLYNKETNQLKLIDFGISKKMVQKELSFTPCGDQLYMAPEMLAGNGYNEKVDMYQIGCILFELLEEIPQIKSIHIIKKMKHNALEFTKTPKFLQSIILSMLCIDQTKRISGSDCLAELQQIIQNYLY